jgi:hypothetical protein
VSGESVGGPVYVAKAHCKDHYKRTKSRADLTRADDIAAGSSNGRSPEGELGVHSPQSAN